MRETLQAITDLLGSPDEEARSRGLELVSHHGGDKAVPWLLLAMKDESIRLRNKAKSLILGKGPEDILPHAEEALRDNADAGRRNAAMEIFTSLSGASLTALMRLAGDPDEEVRNFACVIMGAVASPEAVPALIKALGDESLIVSHAAAEALGRIGDTRAVPALIEELDSSDFWRAFPIITALGQLKDERAVAPLLRFLDNELLALNVALALGMTASPAALGSLLPLLGSEEPAVRTQALQSVVAIYEKMLAEDGWAQADPEGSSGLMERLGGAGFRAFLIGLLSSPDLQVRRDAAVALGWIREERAVARLIELLKEEPLTDTALGSLKAIGAKALVEVRENLDNPVGMVRQALVKYLGSLGLEKGGENLRRMLKDEMSIVRAQAALALGSLRDTDAVDDLILLLGDGNPEAQEAAITALSRLDPKVVCGKLVPYLKNSNPQYMFLAAETLGLIGMEEAVKPLCALLDDPSDIIREVAVKAIGMIGGPGAVPPLMTSLKDKSQRVREQAIISMGRVRDPLVFWKLLELLKDRDMAVRYYAIRALKEYGSPEAAGPLLDMLDGSPKNIQVAAIEALGSIGSPAACARLMKMVGTADIDFIRAMAHAMGDIGCAKAAPWLLAMLAHDHWSVRTAAAASLGKTGGKGALEALAELVKDKDRVVAAAAVRGLGELGDPRSAGLLAHLIADGALSKAASESIKALGPESLPAVLAALEGSPAPLLIKGARLLGGMRSPAATGFLKGLLGYGEPAVRRAAAVALGEAGDVAALPELKRAASADTEEMVRMAARAAARKLEI